MISGIVFSLLLAIANIDSLLHRVNSSDPWLQGTSLFCSQGVSIACLRSSSGEKWRMRMVVSKPVDGHLLEDASLCGERRPLLPPSRSSDDMVCGGGKELRARNAAIERQLRKDHVGDKRELKLLLLGTGESGKSTIVKQMRIIYGQGYTDQDRKEFRVLVYRNLLISMKAIMDFIDRQKMVLRDDSLTGPSYEILDTDEKKFTDIAPLADVLQRLWWDETVQEAVARRAEFTMSDSTPYYFADFARLAAPEYLPTVQDVLRARIATSGIHEFGFDMGKGTSFRMLDVGGQRSERKKWIHCFEVTPNLHFEIFSPLPHV